MDEMRSSVRIVGHFGSRRNKIITLTNHKPNCGKSSGRILQKESYVKNVSRDGAEVNSQSAITFIWLMKDVEKHAKSTTDV